MSIRPGRASNVASAFLSFTLYALIGTTPAAASPPAFSTQYRLKAIPAFVVEAKTKSANEELDRRR